MADFEGTPSQPVDLILGPAVFDRDVFALDEARLLQALSKCAQPICISVGQCRM